MLSKGVVEEIRAAGKDKPNAPPRSHLKTSASSLNVLQCWDQTIGKANWKWSGVTFNCTLDAGGKEGIRIWDPKSLILKCHDHWAKYFTMLVNKETKKFWKNPLEREREKTGGVLRPARKWALPSCFSLIEDSVKGGVMVVTDSFWCLAVPLWVNQLSDFTKDMQGGRDTHDTHKLSDVGLETREREQRVGLVEMLYIKTELQSWFIDDK